MRRALLPLEWANTNCSEVSQVPLAFEAVALPPTWVWSDSARLLMSVAHGALSVYQVVAVQSFSDPWPLIENCLLTR